MQDKRIFVQQEHFKVSDHDVKKSISSISALQKKEARIWAEKIIEAALEDDSFYLDSVPYHLRPSSFIDVLQLPKNLQSIDQALSHAEENDYSTGLWFLAYTLGSVAIVNYHSLIAAWRLMPHYHAAWNGFECAIESMYHESSSQVEQIFTELAKAYYKKPDMIGVARNESNEFNSAVNEWRNDASVRSVWDERKFSYFTIHYVGAELFRFAIKLNVKFGLRLLEIAQLPPLCQFVFLAPEILNDRDVLAQIVEESATTIVNEKTAQWNHKIAAPMVLEMILIHIERLYDNIGRDEEHNSKKKVIVLFQDEEAPSIFKKVAMTILSRNDGAFLSCHYLCHLARRLPSLNEDRWSSLQVFYNILAESMSEKEIGIEAFTVNCGWKFGQPDSYKEERSLGIKFTNNQLPTIYDFAAMLTTIYERELRVSNELELFEYFRQILFSRKNDIHNSGYGGGDIFQWYHYKLALPYVNDENPLTRWQQAWADLSAVRHQMRHHPFQSEEVPKESVKCIALTGIAIFDWLHSGGYSSKTRPLKVLETIWSAIYSLWLQYEGNGNEFWNNLINATLLRFGIYLDQSESKNIALLSLYLKSLGGANRIIAIVACNLKLNISYDSFLQLKCIIEPAVESFLEEEKDLVEKEAKHPALQEACRNLFN